MTSIPMIVLGLALVALVRYFRRIHPDVIEITETRRLFLFLQGFGGALVALGLVFILLLPGEARADQHNDPPQTVDELTFYLITYCNRPYAALWIDPGFAGSAPLASLGPKALRKIEALRQEAISEGQYYVVRTRGPRCPET